MIRSMTGYGSAEKDGFKVEVRSLNHKYLDISVKLPSWLMEHEMTVRKMTRDALERGKIDVFISLSDRRRKNIKIDADLARDIYKAFSIMQEDLSIPGSLDINFFAGFSDILVSEDNEVGSDAIFDALREAISKLEDMRGREGSSLDYELRRRLDNISSRRDEIEGLSIDYTTKYRDKLIKKVNELMASGSLEEARVAQEIAFIAQKSDISEELARLSSHVSQFESFLSFDEPVGRRLDFLCQEMNREANTIASKVDDIGIINLALDIKVEVERLREQVQNVL